MVQHLLQPLHAQWEHSRTTLMDHLLVTVKRAPPVCTAKAMGKLYHLDYVMEVGIVLVDQCPRHQRRMVQVECVELEHSVLLAQMCLFHVHQDSVVQRML